VTFEGLAEGAYTVRAERLGYQIAEGTLEVPGDQGFVVALEPMGVVASDNSGTIVGLVTDEGGQGLSDVGVQVVGQPSARAITDARGRFEIEGLDGGLLEVRFERIGYTERTAEFIVQGGRTVELSVAMPTDAIELEPIAVTVRSLALERSGYYERENMGLGHRFDRAAIERIDPQRTLDLIQRAPGVRLNDPLVSDPRGRGGVGAPSYAYNPRTVALGTRPDIPPPGISPDDDTCYLSLYIDGTRMMDPDLQQIQPLIIEAVEVYLGVNTPIEFSRNRCGAILIWTRR
jgi:hypothetical protein